MIGDGDVKYHTGCSRDCEPFPGATVHVTLAANPSHLEAIDPVVEGKTRALQDRLGKGDKEQVLPLLVHGDAAFAGQGVVAETFNLSQLEGYGTGGTVHVVLNNQIGFTTLPQDARSSAYATDLAKTVMAPVVHVHGEAPEAAVHAIRLALEYRQHFRRDAIEPPPARGRPSTRRECVAQMVGFFLTKSRRSMEWMWTSRMSVPWSTRSVTSTPGAPLDHSRR